MRPNYVVFLIARGKLRFEIGNALVREAAALTCGSLPSRCQFGSCAVLGLLQGLKA